MLRLASKGPATEFFKDCDQHMCILPKKCFILQICRPAADCKKHLLCDAEAGPLHLPHASGLHGTCFRGMWQVQRTGEAQWTTPKPKHSSGKQRLHVKMEGNVQHCERARRFEAVLVSIFCPSHASSTSVVIIQHPTCTVVGSRP